MLGYCSRGDCFHLSTVCYAAGRNVIRTPCSLNRVRHHVKSQRVEFIVFLVGVSLLGITYYLLKQALPASMFLIGVLVYLVALRVLGKYLAKRLAVKEAHGGSDV